MRVYHQQQCAVWPVTAKESTGIMKVAKKYYPFVRWEFSKGELTSERVTLPERPIDEDYERKVFNLFAEELRALFLDAKTIKLQFYSVHEIPTTCFVMEKKKVKHGKLDKLAPTAPIEPEPCVDDEPGPDPD